MEIPYDELVEIHSEWIIMFIMDLIKICCGLNDIATNGKQVWCLRIDLDLIFSVACLLVSHFGRELSKEK